MNKFSNCRIESKFPSNLLSEKLAEWGAASPPLLYDSGKGKLCGHLGATVPHLFSVATLLDPFGVISLSHIGKKANPLLR